MKKAIWFDMDGTIADLYNVPNWLAKLVAEDASPYTAASVIGNMNTLAKAIHKVQAKGYKVGIISWTSKGGSANYNAKVAASKIKWLKKHLGSIKFDTIHIVPYGTKKPTLGGGEILFDDEAANRANWNGKAYTPSNIINVLKSLA